MDVICRSGQNYQVQINTGTHAFIADEPLDVGDDAGPNPYDLLLSALGACSVMTIEMYAKRKNWPLESVEITLKTYKIYARDCVDCDSDPGSRVDVIERHISLTGNLSDEQRARLIEIADKCPIHRTLTSEVKIRTSMVGVVPPG
jgi:putative redox protein